MVDEVVEAAGVHAVGDGVFDKVVVEAVGVDAVVDGVVDEVVPTRVRCYILFVGLAVVLHHSFLRDNNWHSSLLIGIIGMI